MTESGLQLEPEPSNGGSDTDTACTGTKLAQGRSPVAAGQIQSKTASSKSSPAIRPGIVYLAALDSGITRRKGRRGFLYYDQQGNRITDETELDRFSALAIPPAYTDVIISPDPRSHLQAVGRDARGRKQYRYHPDWIAERDREKFAQLVEFARALPDIRKQIDIDLRRRKPGLAKALATVVWLMDKLFIRIGNEAYAIENGSYGLTTLRSKHVKLVGSRLQFRFKGKSGKEWRLSYTDRRIIRAIRMLQELPGQHLFQYLDENGVLHPIRSQDVNAYIREAARGDFSSRQFRIWGATRMAASALAAIPPAATAAGRTRQINEIIDTVAAKLVNTRAVCRGSYIHPGVFASFEEGSLARIAKMKVRKRSSILRWLDEDEAAVLHWLEKLK
ncbi:DNA topoisomerase IB (plasmid) [Rhizobium sp. CB3090]|uniref:DNA topoisomerase IB n=1 Tax=Rhizobium sp. CB3090 TaxID=3039156 RepID=UPI0024B1012E|nr:DNA topoisomerase IB [Rhizobium sp. CB3090]WFU11290.1 DNA topoisomerase IB [Rhizobium sp. CB3090]